MKSKKTEILHICVILALIFFWFIKLQFAPSDVNAQTSSITFGMAGDYAAGTDFHNTINGMKAANLNFVVATGDFSYSSGTTATAWNNYIKTTLGSTFPFELIAGNHDVGYLSEFTSVLGNQISSISKDSLSAYGKQYYFDYPVTSPLIRVILLGPNDSPLNYTYAKGSANYNWVSTAIDSARSTNIPWVAVAMHKNCITSGTKSCEIGTDVFNLFISKHVDLIMQGHDHTYQRSFPLRNATSDPANASACANVTTSFNSACVNQTIGNTYSKSAGTTLVIDGTGGKALYANNNTSQNGYFAAKSFTSFGYTKFTVTSSQISGVFVNNASGGFTDSFTITNSALPSTTPSPTGTNPTPTKSPTPTSGTCSKHSSGDADCNGIVDIVDFEIFRKEFMGQLTTKTADFDGNGLVNILDFEIWRKGYFAGL